MSNGVKVKTRKVIKIRWHQMINLGEWKKNWNKEFKGKPRRLKNVNHFREIYWVKLKSYNNEKASLIQNIKNTYKNNERQMYEYIM